MTKTILALAALACASPAFAQVNGFYEPQTSIYGNTPTTYVWRETPQVNQYPPMFQQRQQTTCRTFYDQIICD